MRLLLIIILLALLFGPLRPWVGRHWAFLVSIVAGAVFGFVLGALVIGSGGGPAFLPVLWALVGAAAFAHGGPAILRHIGKDGRK